MRSKTNEEFAEQVRMLVGDEYIFLDPYHGARTKIRVLHKACGNVYEATPDNFLRGKRCPHEEPKARLKLKDRVEQSISSKNIRAVKITRVDTLGMFRCDICGNLFRKTPRSIIERPTCPICNNEKINWNTETFRSYVDNLTHGEYQLISEYVRSSKKVLIKHLKCGHVYKVMPLNFLKGDRCPNETIKRRADANRLSQKDVQKRILEIYGGEYTILGTYHRMKDKIKIRHNKCGRVFDGTLDALVHGHGCPICKESSGEREVEGYLVDHGIEFERQKSFEGCRYRSLLLFDFYLPQLNMCIEYDGEQHFQPVLYFGGDAKFKDNQRRDSIKNSFCKSHGIKLIRISYLENVNSVLNAEIIS